MRHRMTLHRTRRLALPLALALLLPPALSLQACGAKGGALEIDEWDEGMGPVPRPEECNGLDDDLDGLVAVGFLDGGPGMDGGRLVDAGPRPDGGDGGDLDLRVDEDFRDGLGRYITDAHCGGCGNACAPRSAVELEVGCRLVEESPVCVALRCAEGFTPSSTGRCVPLDRLCLVCSDDGDCGDFEAARCAFVAGERRCTYECGGPLGLGCPEDYICNGEGLCVPEGGSCSCQPGDTFSLACALIDPEEMRCPGRARCDDGVLSECLAPDEVCDEVDNDCDGQIDEGYRDARGAYILDIHHCGECGVDCTLSTVPEGDLICGGDPFSPSCVLACPDAEDGIQPGDRIDADRDIATGCECTVTALDDPPGPVRTEGEVLDVNCDGADGVVVQSFYVAPDGDDTAPGSPSRPMRTVNAALAAAAATLDSDSPRPHVFIASGTYAETVQVPDGVLVHGGYRRDFLALDPDGFRVEIRAPLSTTAPGGAAVEIRGAGVRPTLLEWITVRGLDSATPSSATFGIYALNPRSMLTLRDMTVRAGVPGSGAPGMAGLPGADPTDVPAAGAPPRGAVEGPTHECLPGASNTVAGGAGGRNLCGGMDVRGGDGGSPRCPMFAAFEPSGAPGNPAPGVSGGDGGRGGQDSQGPVTGSSCMVAVCCGLADFTVPGDFQGPQDGRPGRAGSDGRPGAGCSNALGRFDMERWIGDVATGGSGGTAGSGGGGGGGGGGAVMDWMMGACEFADGLGGGGGGGGGGGCGGEPGAPGTSGGPSVAILIRYTMGASGDLPSFQNVRLWPSDGGRGGDGGAGGEGGRGGSGAFGGELLRSDRTTPTLAGPFPGGRGGPGGNGGGGGGGGGGCGGATVGVWLTGMGGTEPPRVLEWRADNVFTLGRPGLAGEGGGGTAPGGDGAAGGAIDVLVR